MSSDEWDLGAVLKRIKRWKSTHSSTTTSVDTMTATSRKLVPSPQFSLHAMSEPTHVAFFGTRSRSAFTYITIDLHISQSKHKTNKIVDPCSRLSTAAGHACATFREYRPPGSSSIMHTKKTPNHVTLCWPLTYDLDIQWASKGCQGNNYVHA